MIGRRDSDDPEAMRKAALAVVDRRHGTLDSLVAQAEAQEKEARAALLAAGVDERVLAQHAADLLAAMNRPPTREEAELFARVYASLEEEVICEDCHGLGHMQDVACDLCSGTGKVPEQRCGICTKTYEACDCAQTGRR